MIYHNLNILNKRFVAIKPCNRCTFSMYVTFYIETVRQQLSKWMFDISFDCCVTFQSLTALLPDW